MTRKYRIGEVLDFEIKTLDIIDPLTKLLLEDEYLADRVLEPTMVKLINQLHDTECSDIKDAMETISKSSSQFYKPLFKLFLDIIYQSNKIPIGLKNLLIIGQSSNNETSLITIL